MREHKYFHSGCWILQFTVRHIYEKNWRKRRISNPVGFRSKRPGWAAFQPMTCINGMAFEHWMSTVLAFTTRNIFPNHLKLAKPVQNWRNRMNGITRVWKQPNWNYWCIKCFKQVQHVNDGTLNTDWTALMRCVVPNRHFKSCRVRQSKVRKTSPYL
jgi:hypothetical protein